MSDLTEEFFRVFGIETECHNPIVYLSGDKKCKDVCQNCEQYKYPKITIEKLIQIFLLLNQWYDWRYGVDIEAENVEDFKKEVLQKCIDTYDKGWVAYDGFEPKNTGLYEGIQQLFKEEQ